MVSLIHTHKSKYTKKLIASVLLLATVAFVSAQRGTTNTNTNTNNNSGTSGNAGGRGGNTTNNGTNSGTNTTNDNNNNSGNNSGGVGGFINGIFTGNNGTQLTNNDMVNGLTEALKLGIGNATKSASKTDGFFKNPEIFIPFPKEVEIVKTTVEKVGLKKQVDDFVKSLNRAAEKASVKAGPIFLDALKQMTITDALTILQAKDAAATQYLKTKTIQPLSTAFAPVVNDALSSTGVNKAWKFIADYYNKIPFVQKVNPDLGKYVTEKGLEGIFKLLGNEELKIRKDPGAWGNNIINNVFGAFKG